MTYYDGQYHLDEEDIMYAIANWMYVDTKCVNLYVDDNREIRADVDEDKAVQR